MILRALPALLFGAIVLVAVPAGALLEDSVDSTTSELDTTVDDTTQTVDDTTTETTDDTTETVEDTAEETLPSTGDSLNDDEDPDSTSSDDNSTDPDSSSSSDDGSGSTDDGSADGSVSSSDDGDTGSSGDGSKLSPALRKALSADSGEKDATFDPTREDAVDTDGDGIPDAYASDVAASGSRAVEPGPQNASGQIPPDTQFVEAPGLATVACLAAVGLAMVACVRRR